MIPLQEARDLATRWLQGAEGTGGSIALLEFGGGWIAWNQMLNAEEGSAGRVVIDRDTGDVRRWPPLPVAEIITRYTAPASPRFPADVEAHLRWAGWQPDRRVPTSDLDRYAHRLQGLADEDELGPLGIVEAAHEFLTEFCGLSVTTAATAPRRFYP
jgi:hypothetical protein